MPPIIEYDVHQRQGIELQDCLILYMRILYIKSASDRIYLQQRVLLPQRAAQKLRRINNERSPGVTLPTLSTSEKCVVTAKTHS